MEGKVRDKVIIVTGGASGSGVIVSKKLASEGAKLIITGICGEPVESVVNELIRDGFEVMGYTGDISSEVKAKECITMTVNNFGRIDGLIELSGIVPSMDKVEDYSSESFYHLVRNNIFSSFNITRFAIPELKKTKGTLVFTGADAGIKGLPENSAYGGTKGFIISFAKGLARELKNDGIKVYCVTGFPIEKPYNTKTNGLSANNNDLGLNENYLKRVAQIYNDLVTGYEYDGVVYNLEPEAISPEKIEKSFRKAMRKDSGRKRMDLNQESGD
jgi:NAD(P)-dependent dehydrogenase (short-subunit alcohol dehydrogenase family)